jgi:hypothetical protein
MRDQDPKRSMILSVTDELLRNNEGYAASFDKGGLPPPRA